MPVMVFNRSFFNCYYEIEGFEPGEYIFIVSGWGNEYFEKKFKKVAKRDVVGVMNLNYHAIKPVKNHYGEVIGTRLQQVSSINLGGHIPDIMKAKFAKGQARTVLKMLAYLRDKPFCMCPRHAANSMQFAQGDLLTQMEVLNMGE